MFLYLGMLEFELNPNLLYLYFTPLLLIVVIIYLFESYIYY